MSEASQTYRYSPGEMDWLLLHWMTRMKHDNELEHTLSRGAHTPLAFLEFMAQRQLFFRLSDLHNISYAAWFEPLMGNTFLGFYVSPDVRDKHEEKVYFLYDMLNLAFTAGARVVVGLIQERTTARATQKFIKLHIRLGYTYCGFVPHLFDNENCHIVAHTIENWEGQCDGRWQSKWRANRRGAGPTFVASTSLNGSAPA